MVIALLLVTLTGFGRGIGTFWTASCFEDSFDILRRTFSGDLHICRFKIEDLSEGSILSTATYIAHAITECLHDFGIILIDIFAKIPANQLQASTSKTSTLAKHFFKRVELTT